MSLALRRVAAAALAVGGTYAGVTTYTTPPRPTTADLIALQNGGLERVPSRDLQLRRLRASAPDPVRSFDVLVIGGGATGAACALDGTLRDLKVALVERDDYGSGTSSRSTKLIHGGVRYLEKAFFNLDPSQLRLVFEALSERGIMLNQAPHLAQSLPTLLPCYKLWEIPFYFVGLKVYDLIASLGHSLLYVSKFMSAKEAMRTFPTLSKSSSNQALKGVLLYYDGQMDDSRFNVALALTAAIYGATTVNHTEVVSLIKDEADDGRVVGAHCRDVLTGDEFDVYAKVVINATGPFTDHVRKMDNPDTKDMIVPSSGVHVTLPSYYSPQGMGLIVPKTKDGRVVFMLPWLNTTIAGTTDSSTQITELPKPHTDEVAFILDALSDYLCIDVRAKDVQSAWSGIRPLAIDPDAPKVVKKKKKKKKKKEKKKEEKEEKKDAAVGEVVEQGKEKETEKQEDDEDEDEEETQNIVREHIVTVSDNGLVTITGGKWTTQRVMGEETINKAIEIGNLHDRASRCKTRFVKLIGAHKWDESYFTFLAQRYNINLNNNGSGSGSGGAGRSRSASNQLDIECAQHLSMAYGDQAYKIAEIAEKGFGQRLVQGYPVIEAEVVYCVDHEYCETAVDFLARRSRLIFLDTKAATIALPRVIDLMGDRLQWSVERKKKEVADALRVIESFSCHLPQQ